MCNKVWDCLRFLASKRKPIQDLNFVLKTLLSVKFTCGSLCSRVMS